MKMLQLPPTIRTAKPNEVPKQTNTLDKIAESKAANIVEGYVFHYNESHELPFIFFAEINVDNQRLWQLFKILLLQLPEVVCLVYNYKDEEPAYSSYTDKYRVLNKLEAHELEIIQDGFLEVGVLYNDDAMMEEVFIRSSKYLQYWSSDETRFRKTMLQFEIFEIPTLNFIDQYTLVTKPLQLYYPNAKETSEVLKQFEELV